MLPPRPPPPTLHIFICLYFSISFLCFLSQGILVLLLKWRLFALKIKTEMDEEHKPEQFPLILASLKINTNGGH